MDLRLLRAFVTAADTPTFSEAAAALNITQPALTKQIQQLEALSGLQLFRRGRRGASLTVAGVGLVSEARAIVTLADAFESRLRRMSAGEEGSLSVGFGLSSIAIAPRVVAAFRSVAPGVSVRLEDMSSSAQIESVRHGELDVAFARLPAPPDLRAIPVLSDALVIASPEEWASPADDVSPSAWLRGRSLVRLSSQRGPGLATQTSRYLSGLGVTPRIVQEADDLQTVLALVAAGVGAAIVPKTAQNIAPPRVQMHPLQGEVTAWEVGAVWHPENETPPVRMFLEELTRIVRSNA